MTAPILVVGGVSGMHDPLLAAVLRARGHQLETIHVPDAEAQSAGRALLARGHCNPTYYLAGALVGHLRAQMAREGRAAHEVARARVHLTVGSCGPCRYATYVAEYRRALEASGFGALPVVVIDQAAPRASEALARAGIGLDAALLAAFARACVLGDVLVQAACAHRPTARAPAAVDVAVAEARRGLERALEARRLVVPLLEGLGRRLRSLPQRDAPGAPVRARVVGEFFASVTDGPGSCDLPRLLERLGAQVQPAAVTEWLLYLLWSARRAAEEPAPFAPTAVRTTARRLRRRSESLRALHRRYAAAAGLDAALADMEDLAELARPHYACELRGGAGHLEVGAFLQTERDRSAELVVSIKPFGCLPSSAVSDGVLGHLARWARHAAFVALETTGDAEVQVESRLALAVDAARGRAEGRGDVREHA